MLVHGRKANSRKIDFRLFRWFVAYQTMVLIGFKSFAGRHVVFVEVQPCVFEWIWFASFLIFQVRVYHHPKGSTICLDEMLNGGFQDFMICSPLLGAKGTDFDQYFSIGLVNHQLELWLTSRGVTFSKELHQKPATNWPHFMTCRPEETTRESKKERVLTDMFEVSKVQKLQFLHVPKYVYRCI